MSLGIQASIKLIHSTGRNREYIPVYIKKKQVNPARYNLHLLYGQAHGIYCSDQMAAFWASGIADIKKDNKKAQRRILIITYFTQISF